MRKRIEWKWEQLDENTFRAKVRSGWLVIHKSSSMIGGGKITTYNLSESMQFVPDNDHQWEILPPLNEVSNSGKSNTTAVNAKDFES